MIEVYGFSTTHVNELEERDGVYSSFTLVPAHCYQARRSKVGGWVTCLYFYPVVVSGLSSPCTSYHSHSTQLEWRLAPFKRHVDAFIDIHRHLAVSATSIR